jgi:phosphoglycerate dehydrogenase-like enzyme
MGPAARLLVTFPADPAARSRIATRLAGVPVAYAADGGALGRSGVEAMLTGNLVRELPAIMPEALPDLRFVQTLYTGVDGFPFDRIPDRAKVAGNVGAYAPFVAEHAVALLLSLARGIPEGHRQVAGGRLRPTEPLTHLGGRRVLLVGYGAIAREVAERLRPFGAELVGVNRSGATRPGVDRMLPVGELLAALPTADAVIDTLPLTRATRGVFDDRAFGAMRPDALFVNVGRAATVDPAALERRLAGHPRFRVGLDVWWGEDFVRGTVELPFPLDRYPNLIGSPHRAGVVPEARAVVLERALDNLARYFAGEPPRYVADRAEYA